MTCFCPGADATSSPHGKDTLKRMVDSANARLLTKMGRVYIYSKPRISKGMFDDVEFRVMCQAFYEEGGGRDTAPILRRHALLKYVNAEFEFSANCAKSWDRTCSSTQKAINSAKKWTMEQHLLQLQVSGRGRSID